MPRIANKPPEARGEAWNMSFPIMFRRNQSYQLLDFGLLASKTVSKYLFALLFKPLSL